MDMSINNYKYRQKMKKTCIILLKNLPVSAKICTISLQFSLFVHQSEVCQYNTVSAHCL